MIAFPPFHTVRKARGPAAVLWCCAWLELLAALLAIVTLGHVTSDARDVWTFLENPDR